jgi:predicted amidohydrolase
MNIAPWRACCVQMRSDLAFHGPNRTTAWSIIDRNIAGAMRLIEHALTAPQAPRLFVLPEFGFQGAPLDAAVAAWIDKACYPVPGPITAPLQELARRRGIFIGGNQFESAEDWPGRYFNTCFLIDPRGEVILRYRRINTAVFPSPHDFMDAYLARYGKEEIFPVVDTELGCIAMIACGEISVPEVARVMMMQGAEIVLHPTNAEKSQAQDAAKVARAVENMVYLISANVAGPIGFSRDRSVPGGHSRILDYRGTLLAYQEDAVETTSVSAVIDVEALRRTRREDCGPSSLLRARFEMYRPFYQAAAFYPPNSFLKTPMADLAATAPAIAASRRNLARLRVIVEEEA